MILLMSKILPSCLYSTLFEHHHIYFVGHNTNVAVTSYIVDWHCPGTLYIVYYHIIVGSPKMLLGQHTIVNQ